MIQRRLFLGNLFAPALISTGSLMSISTRWNRKHVLLNRPILDVSYGDYYTTISYVGVDDVSYIRPNDISSNKEIWRRQNAVILANKHNDAVQNGFLPGERSLFFVNDKDGLPTAEIKPITLHLIANGDGTFTASSHSYG